jgi:hypothetical protein
MLRKYLSTFLFALVLTTTIHSQAIEPRIPYVSVHTGIFNITRDNFDKVYDSNLGFVYGFGAGLPLTPRLYLFGKVTIFSKTGTPILITYSMPAGTFITSKLYGGTAKYTEWISNFGFMYNFFLSPDISLGLNTGFMYINYTEDQTDSDGKNIASEKGSGVIGFFGGACLEKYFNHSPFSAFFEIQFNSSLDEIIKFTGNSGGININVGARLYFKERNFE